MTADPLDRLAGAVGEFVRFVLLWAGLGSVTSPLRPVLSAATGQRLPSWLGPVAAAVLTSVVYWSAGRLSWRLVGRAWLCGVVVAVGSVVGFVFLPLDDGAVLVSVAAATGWWLLSVGVGVALTSPTLWRAFRARVLLRPRS
jgi:hypothetical protein